MPTNPTPGAMRAAFEMGGLFKVRPILVDTNECERAATIIDREAVQPAVAEVRERYAEAMRRAAGTLESMQWREQYSRCPVCGKANPKKMEFYRDLYRKDHNGSDEGFREDEFGHAEPENGWGGCHLAKSISDLRNALAAVREKESK